MAILEKKRQPVHIRSRRRYLKRKTKQANKQTKRETNVDRGRRVLRQADRSHAPMVSPLSARKLRSFMHISQGKRESDKETSDKEEDEDEDDESDEEDDEDESKGHDEGKGKGERGRSRS